MSGEGKRPSVDGFVRSPEPVHTLLVQDDGEFEFSHPADCPMVERWADVMDPDCLLGRILHDEGYDASDLAPGEYLATAWAYQSHDYRTLGEWQSGIDLTPSAKESQRPGDSA